MLWVGEGEEGGRESGRKGGREGERKGGREEGKRKGVREEEKEGGREEKEGIRCTIPRKKKRKCQRESLVAQEGRKRHCSGLESTGRTHSLASIALKELLHGLEAQDGVLDPLEQ